MGALFSFFTSFRYFARSATLRGRTSAQSSQSLQSAWYARSDPMESAIWRMTALSPPAGIPAYCGSMGAPFLNHFQMCIRKGYVSGSGPSYCSSFGSALARRHALMASASSR